MIGFIEVTQGCTLSSRVSGPMGLLLAAFVGFGGLSIMGQVAAILMGSGVHLKSIAHPTAGRDGFAAVVLFFYPGLQPVMAVIMTDLLRPAPAGALWAVCLVIAAAMLLVGRPKPAEFTL